MRWIALLGIAAACGAEPKQPFLANAPHPDNAAVAGAAAGAAAALTIVDPNAATRGKPEKPKQDVEKNPVEVKENVPASVLDRLDDQGAGSGSGSAVSPAKATAKPAPAPKRKGPAPRIPSPTQAAESAEGSGS